MVYNIHIECKRRSPRRREQGPGFRKIHYIKEGMVSMNKNDLVKELAKRSGNTIAGTKAIVDDLFDLIGTTIGKGEKVSILGFGTFGIVEKQARSGRNPQTGEAMTIPAHKAVKFKAGRKLTTVVQ